MQTVPDLFMITLSMSMRSTKKLDLAALISFITLFLKDTNICLSVNELDLRESFKALSLSFINLRMSLEIQGRVQYMYYSLRFAFLEESLCYVLDCGHEDICVIIHIYSSYDLIPVNIFYFSV